MTLVAVFSDAKTTHLISDSLISIPIINLKEEETDKWLSTGVFLDKKGQIKYNFSEGLLKIWVLQNNLAIGFAGDVESAFEALSILTDRSKQRQFRSFLELKDFLQKSVVPSVTPSERDFGLCGFIKSSGICTKFKLLSTKGSPVKLENSTDPNTVYFIGSGSEDFMEIWRRIPPLRNRPDVPPSLTFSLIAEQLYIKQFIGKSDLITRRYTGGAITGVYYQDENISWQPSRVTITFANIGGTGFDAHFIWLPLVYKTWHHRGNVFSSSMFEQKGHFFQRITQYSNPLSEHLHFNETDLLPEMTTFNAEVFHAILLPKGISSEFPAVLRATGKIKAFDEIIEGRRIVALRLNKQFFRRLSNEFFVTPDYTIKFGYERLEALVAALRNRLQIYSQSDDPSRWVKLQSELGIRLVELGGKTDNLGLLSEALGCFLSAWNTAKKLKLPLVDDTIYNVNLFLSDLRRNLTPDRLSLVLAEHDFLLSEYNKQKRAGQ